MTYHLVTIESPHASCPVYHGSWPQLDGHPWLSAHRRLGGGR
jgi:hypothetical protein